MASEEEAKRFETGFNEMKSRSFRAKGFLVVCAQNGKKTELK